MPPETGIAPLPAATSSLSASDDADGMKRSKSLDFIRHVFTRFAQHKCTGIAASLTFTTLLSLVPVVVMTLSVIAAFPAFSEISTKIKIFLLTTMVPEMAGKVIAAYMEQFASNAARLTAIGTLFLAVTALSLMLTIDKALNSIWRITHLRPLSHRLLIYWAILTIGPILMGISLSLTSWMAGASTGLTEEIPGASMILVPLATLILTSFAFSIPYLIVPNRPVPWRHALAGGTAAAIGFEILDHGFAFYIANFPTYQTVYGTFASVPIFLLWIYLSWLIILLGAVITASLSTWHFGQTPRNPGEHGQEFVNALILLKILNHAFRNGQTENYRTLHQKSDMDFEDMEEILNRLNQAGLIHQEKAGGGWLQIADPARIRIADIYHLFVFNPLSISSMVSDNPGITALLTDLTVALDSKMHMSLSGFFVEPATPETSPSPAPATL